MPLYMKMSQNINKTARHLKFRYIRFLQIFYGVTMKGNVQKLYATRSIKNDKKDKE